MCFSNIGRSLNGDDLRPAPSLSKSHTINMAEFSRLSPRNQVMCLVKAIANLKKTPMAKTPSVWKTDCRM